MVGGPPMPTSFDIAKSPCPWNACICVAVGALPTVTSNTKVYVLPGPPEVTEMLPPSMHQRFALPLMLHPDGVFGPCPSTTQLPVPLGNELSATLLAPVNWTENEFKVPDAVAPVVSMVITTKNPPEPSEPPDVNV